MGIGATDLRLLMTLKAQGYIPQGSSVIEIGAQQLADSFLACRQELEAMGKLFGIEQPCPLLQQLAPTLRVEGLKPLDPDAPWARQFWTWLELSYAAIDIDGSPGSIAMDLNYDDVPAALLGKYQLVTNFGTTEHVANQLNAFKIIHDLTDIGGVMIHNVPAQGMFNHGLVNYSPKFFWLLSRSNGYRWLHMDFTHSGDARGLPSDMTQYIAGFVPNFVERSNNYHAVDCGLIAIMQKVYDIPYVAPLDVNTGTHSDNETLRQRYWTVFQPNAFEPLPLLQKRLNGIISRLRSKLFG